MIYKMDLKDSSDTMTFNLLETPIVDKDIEGAVDNVTLDGNQYTDYLWLKKQYIQKWAILCDTEYTQLRGFYTRQFENATIPTYRLYYGTNNFLDKTVSGEYITTTVSGIEQAPIADISLLGNAEQTTYSGKNLFNKDGATFVASASTTVSPIATGIRASYSGSSTTGARYVGFLLGDVSQYVGKNIVISADISASASNAPRLAFGFCDSSAGNRQTIDWLEQTGSIYHTITSSDVAGHSYIYIYAYANYSTGTVASGDYIDYTDLQVEISTSTTPTDYEPYVGGTASPNPDYPQPISTVTGEQTITVTGKNLWSFDSSYTTATAGWVLADTAVSIPAGTYTFSCTLSPSGAAARLNCKYADNADNFINVPSSGVVVATFSEEVKKIALRLNSGNSTISDIQLELGSTATAYEPYQSQEYEINLGKNLFSGFATLATGSTYDNDTGTLVSATSSSNISNDIAVKPNAAYYLNFTTGAQTRIYIREYDGAGNMLVDTTKYVPYGFTTNASTAFVRVYFSPSTSEAFPVTVKDIQLEQSATPSDFAPYFTPIELAKIGTYQDRIYPSDGKWYIEKQVGKVVFDGTENWQSYTTAGVQANFIGVSDIYVATSASTNFIGLSNFFTPTSQVNLYNNDVDGISFRVSRSQLIIKKVDSTTVSAFKTWLSTHPITVYYALATPTDTEITDSDLLADLNALGASKLYLGVNNITTLTASVKPTLNIKFTEIYSRETDVISTKAVRLTLTDGGVINNCGCRQDVQLTMRETVS